MVKFKRQPENGRAVLMEINGHPWGSIQLAIESGIDYPRFLVDWYLEGKRPPVEVAYKHWIACRRIIGELRHLEHLFYGTPAGLAGALPNFWLSAIGIAVPWYLGMRYDDVWLSDPRPGFEPIWQWMRQKAGRGRLA